MEKKKILEVKDLSVSFQTNNGIVNAIRGINFDLYEGETLAIVGESGSGKSVSTRAIMGIISSNGRCDSGEIIFNNQDITKLNEQNLQKIRGKDIAMIFQDPMTSLNPVMTIGKQISESMIKHQNMSKSEAKEKAIELISLVGISNPEERYNQYPHQFSGGMRQRIVIAIALACNPKILICDEPTTALDVTIQAQIIELINELQKKTGVSVIFITHDLGVVANVADRVMVMYAGRVVEQGTVDEIFYTPLHPYTWGLLASMPTLETNDSSLYSIPGSPPDMLNPPKGDAFAPRNEFAMKIDFEEQPPMFKVTDTHYAATWLLHKDAPKIEPPAAIKKLWEGANFNGKQ